MNDSGPDDAPGPRDESQPSDGEVPDERRSVSRNLADMLGSQALTWVTATVVTVVQPRFLGDVGQGQIRLAYSIWLIVDVIVTLGTNTFLTLEAAKSRERGLAMVRPVLVGRAAGFVVGWGAMTVYLVATGASRQLTIVIVLIGFVTMLASASATARSALIGLENMRFPAIADIASKLTSTVIVITVLLLGGRVVAVSVVFLAAAVVNTTLMYYYLRRFPRRDRSIAIPVKVVMLGGVSYLAAEASLIVYQQVDTVIMSILVDEGELGWYAAADQLFASFLFVPTILMMTLFPVFGRLNSEDPERLRSLVSRAVTTVLLFSVPIGLGTVAMGPSIASLIFGPDFEGAGPVLAVLGVVIIITSETILIGQYAIATGHQRFWTVLMIAGIAATIPLDLVLVPWTEDRYANGAIGGALAYVVTETLMLVVGIIRFGGVAVDSRTRGRALRTVGSGLLMLAAVWPLRDMFMPLPIAVGAVVYGVAALATGAIGADERAAFERVLSRFRR